MIELLWLTFLNPSILPKVSFLSKKNLVRFLLLITTASPPLLLIDDVRAVKLGRIIVYVLLVLSTWYTVCLLFIVAAGVIPTAVAPVISIVSPSSK